MAQTRLKTPKRLSIGDLIDLELQVERDRHDDLSKVRQRDAEIGVVIEAEKLAPPRLFLAWLAEMRRGGRIARPSVGQRTQQLLELVGMTLFIVGVVLGAAAVGPWLAYDTERPVNVIFFWCSIVGVQIVLLLGWVIAALPSGWLAHLPGTAALQTLLRGIGRAVPVITTWISTRLSFDYREAVADVRASFKRLDWLYGKLRLWMLIRLTQVFAVAYNLGAIGTFVALSYGTDPTFGWKSTLMSADGLHGAVRVISSPWSMWPAAVPTLEQVEGTQYSSLDTRFIGRSKNDRTEDVARWKSWLPFLLASLLCYGLAPRLLTCLISHWQVRRILSGAALDHREFQKLAERLHRPRVDTRALSDEGGGGRPDDNNGHTLQHVDLRLGDGPVPVLQWAGVDLPRERLDELLRARLDVSIGELFVVGDLEEQGDAAALAKLRSAHPDSGVVVLVEAWEPPIADYIDFIRQLRKTLGDGRLIVVLLYHQDADGEPASPESIDRRVWNRCLNDLGDPWLCVEPLIEEAAVAGDGAEGSA